MSWLSAYSFLLVLFFLAGCAIEQSKFQATHDSTRDAIVRGKTREALSALEAKALDAERNKNWEEAAEYYRHAAKLATTSGQLQKAVSYGNKILEMGEKAGSPEFQMRAISQLAPAYRQLGLYAKLREALQKGTEILKEIPSGGFRDDHSTRTYSELGMVSLRQGENEKAIEYFSEALQIIETRIGRFYQQRRRNPDLIVAAREGRLSTLSSLGTAYQRAGKLEQAIKAYQRGLDMIKESGLNTPMEADLYHGLGQLYLRQKDFPRAQQNLKKALEMAEKFQHAPLLQHASSDMGDLFRQIQRPSEAIPHYRKAIETVESTRSLLQSEELRSSFFEDKRQIYAGMILTHLQARDVEEAFNTNERARSRAFLDILGSKVQLAREGALLEGERDLQARINALKAKMLEPGEDEDAPDEGQLGQELEAAQNAYTDFLSKVRKENKEQASLMNVEPLTLKEVQGLLGPGVTLLEYFVVQQQVLLWVVEKDRFRFVWIPVVKGDLVSKVSSLRDTINQVGEREKFKSASQELYRLLIEAALPHVRGKELLIIPHDALHYLPFQALLSAQGRYLIQDYPIYYLSSASLMQFTREKRRASRERALVMGNPSLGDPAYNLRFAEREAKEVARLYPQSAVYLRDEATKSRAVSLSPTYDILHFAVHGELREEDPLSSALLLAGEGEEDGRLTAGEIFSLNLKADTVVLSACESGLGKITSGDEIIGLTRAFIYAGTPSIVTSLWKVNDRASYELMREFYGNLKTMKKAEALRQAQVKTMEDYPEPYFWAAYGLTGDP